MNCKIKLPKFLALMQYFHMHFKKGVPYAPLMCASAYGRVE